MISHKTNKESLQKKNPNKLYFLKSILHPTLMKKIGIYLESHFLKITKLKLQFHGKKELYVELKDSKMQILVEQ